MNAGDLAMEKGDVAAAGREYGAAEALAPDSAEMLFWHAVTLAGAGRVEDAKPLLARAYGIDPNWRTLVERLPAAKLLAADLVPSLTAVKARPPQGAKAAR
jgi:Flp pilus assembly protein TadD